MNDVLRVIEKLIGRESRTGINGDDNIKVQDQIAPSRTISLSDGTPCGVYKRYCRTHGEGTKYSASKQQNRVNKNIRKL